MINITPYKLSLIFVDPEDHDDHIQDRTLHSDRDLEDYLDDDAGVGE